MLVDAVLHTGRQENDSHCDAEASGVILLNFSRYLHYSAGSGCVFVMRPTHEASRCDFVLVRCLYYVRITLPFGKTFTKKKC